MNLKTGFLVLGFWYFCAPRAVQYFVYHFFSLVENMFVNMNRTMNPDMWLKDEEAESKEFLLRLEEDVDVDPNDGAPEAIVEKYEDKYVAHVRTLKKKWAFTEEEFDAIAHLMETIYKGVLQEKSLAIEDIELRIARLKRDICDDTASRDIEVLEWDDDSDVLEGTTTTLEERNQARNERIEHLQEKLDQLKYETETQEGFAEVREEAYQVAKQRIIEKRIDKLQHCFVMEKTPHGNVLMIYNAKRESFSYYSDSTIPYRYLEVVARKYVKMFDCRPIFVDMEEEIALFEEKWERDQEAKEAKRLKEQEEEEERKKLPVMETVAEPKKNVFAKFKSYNKDAGGGVGGKMVAPPKNSIPTKAVSEAKENEKIILKERANRYTYEGKFANFNFLQKVEKKVFNKNLGVSFADFKKMHKK